MLIRSPALDRLLVEFGSREKILGLGESVVEAIVDRALPMGYLRLHSQRNDLRLKFDGVTYTAWVDRASFDTNIANLIREVLNNSQRHDLSHDILRDGIAELQEANYDPFEICCGEDLIEILSIGLRGKLGSNQPNQVNTNTLRQSLRLAYEGQEFRDSKVGKAILTWQDQLTDFQVLR